MYNRSIRIRSFGVSFKAFTEDLEFINLRHRDHYVLLCFNSLTTFCLIKNLCPVQVRLGPCGMVLVGISQPTMAARGKHDSSAPKQSGTNDCSTSPNPRGIN